MGRVWWIRVQRTEHQGHACRELLLADAEGAEVASARAFPWRREIAITRGTLLPARLVRRPLFLFTGRVDALDEGGTRVGILSRRGIVRDAAGVERGRFHDARTWRDLAGEGLADVAGAILTGGDGDEVGRGPDGFHWLVGGAVQGSLRRAPWPFGADAVPSSRGWLRDLLRRLGRPQGWRLEFASGGPTDGLLLAGALWQVELANW